MIGDRRIECVLIMKRLEHVNPQKLLESAPDAMLVIDQQGTIVFINSQTEKLFGYSQQELNGQSIEVLMPKSVREKHVKHRTDYAADPHLRPMGVGLELFRADERRSRVSSRD